MVFKPCWCFGNYSKILCLNPIVFFKTRLKKKNYLKWNIFESVNYLVLFNSQKILVTSLNLFHLLCNQNMSSIWKKLYLRVYIFVVVVHVSFEKPRTLFFIMYEIFWNMIHDFFITFLSIIHMSWYNTNIIVNKEIYEQ